MLSVLPRRLFSAVPVLLIVSLITFAMIHLIPGDPAAAIAGMSAAKFKVDSDRIFCDDRSNRSPMSAAISGLINRCSVNCCIGTATSPEATLAARCCLAFRC